MVSPKLFYSLTTISSIAVLLFFFLFSLSFILHFRLRTLRSHHLLRDFNSLWPVRILLITSAFLWSLCEFLRIPLNEHHPFLPCIALSLSQSGFLCKIYLVSSLGLFQPCFFATLLFLVSSSLNKNDEHYQQNTFFKALSVILPCCIPVFCLQLFFVFFASKFVYFWHPPEVFWRYFVLVHKAKGGKSVQCTYPLISTGILGGFSSVYVVCFVGVCWRAVSLAINKSLRNRLCGLAISVVLSLSLQFLAMALSVIWRPGELGFEVSSLISFFAVLACTLVGEGLLVIRPMADALIVEGSLINSLEDSSSSPPLSSRKRKRCCCLAS